MTLTSRLALVFHKSFIGIWVILDQGSDYWTANCSIWSISNVWIAHGKPLFFLKLNLLPRWIPQYDIETTRPPCLLILRYFAFCRHSEYSWESQVPMKKLVLLSQPYNLVNHPGSDVEWVALDIAEDLFGDRISELVRFLPHEGSAPGVSPETTVAIVTRLDKLFIICLFAINILYGIVAYLVQLHHTGGKVAQAVPGPDLAFGIKERTITFTLLAVALLKFRTYLFIIAFDSFKGAVWNTLSKQSRCGPEEAIAVLDMCIQERKRLAGFDGLHPEIDLAKFYRHGIDIYAIDAVTDHVAQGSAAVFRSWFLIAGAHGSQSLGDAVGSGDQEMSAAAGRVADFEVENGLLGVRLRTGFCQDGLKGRIEQAIDQAGGRIVAAGGLAFVTTGEFQFKCVRFKVDHRVHFEQGFVDTAQFFRAKVFVIHYVARSTLEGKGQGAHSFQEVVVGQFAAHQVGNSIV